MEMWFLRRNLEIIWTDEVTNEEVLQRAGTKRWMINSIAKRQASFFSHIIRKQGLENLAMTAKILGRKSRGRQRRQHLDQIKEWTGIKQTEVLLRAANTRNLQTVNVHWHDTRRRNIAQWAKFKWTAQQILLIKHLISRRSRIWNHKVFRKYWPLQYLKTFLVCLKFEIFFVLSFLCSSKSFCRYWSLSWTIFN